MQPIPLTVAELAHEYDAATDEIRRLAEHGEHTPRRLVAFERALASAEHIVLLTDSGDWRTKARNAKTLRDKAMTAAAVHYGQIERKAKSMDTLSDVAGRQFRGVVTDPQTGEPVSA